MRRLRRSLTTLALGILAMSAASVVATRPAESLVLAPDCNSASEARQPVLLVHGFNSSASAWDDSKQSFANRSTCVATFDYADNSTDWVTSPAIGRALGAKIHQLASASPWAGWLPDAQ
jgi:pimeloyl-ACP methyl ester carboxylesterase